jgi:hypothetical protein
LAEVALRAGFSDQSKFSFHFKRLIGITPGQFRLSARIAYTSASPAEKRYRNSSDRGIPIREGKDYASGWHHVDRTRRGRPVANIAERSSGTFKP